MLSDQYTWTGRAEDQVDAISNAQRAVAVTPQDHPELLALLNNLANALSNRYERTGSLDDLEEAINMRKL